MIGKLLALALHAFIGAHTIHVSETLVSFNAQRGDIVVMIMNDTSPAAIERCQHYGATPMLNQHTGILTCEGIDF